jgi:hypothetical protein
MTAMLKKTKIRALCHCIFRKTHENRIVLHWRAAMLANMATLPCVAAYVVRRRCGSFPNPAIPSPCSDGFLKTPKDGDSSKTETGILAAGTKWMNSDVGLRKTGSDPSSLAPAAQVLATWPWFMRGRGGPSKPTVNLHKDSDINALAAKLADSEQTLPAGSFDSHFLQLTF